MSIEWIEISHFANMYGDTTTERLLVTNKGNHYLGTVAMDVKGGIGYQLQSSVKLPDCEIITHAAILDTPIQSTVRLTRSHQNRIVAKLVKYGFSTPKAMEIELDYRHKQKYAMAWVDVVEKRITDEMIDI